MKLDVEQDLSANEQFVDGYLTADGNLSVATALEQVQGLATNWYNRSRKELFYVLSKCYDIYQRIENAPDEATRSGYESDLRAEYEKLEHDSESKYTNHRVVAVVFRHADMDRRQRSKYATVLKKALKDETPYEDFIRWLQMKGGINAVASGKKSEPKVKDANADLASAKSASVMGAVSLEESGQALTFNKPAYVLLAMPSANDPSVLEVKKLWGNEDEDKSFVEKAVGRYATWKRKQDAEAEDESDSTDDASDLASTAKEDE